MRSSSLGRDFPLQRAPAHQLLRALVCCLGCGERRLVELHPGDFVVLRRDGTLNLPCPTCHAFGGHRFIRFGP